MHTSQTKPTLPPPAIHCKNQPLPLPTHTTKPKQPLPPLQKTHNHTQPKPKQPLPQDVLHGAYVFSTRALARVTAIDVAPALQVCFGVCVFWCVCVCLCVSVWLCVRVCLCGCGVGEGRARGQTAAKRRGRKQTNPPTNNKQQQAPGVVDVVTADDIPGKNDLSTSVGDEMLLVRACVRVCLAGVFFIPYTPPLYPLPPPTRSPRAASANAWGRPWRSSWPPRPRRRGRGRGPCGSHTRRRAGRSRCCRLWRGLSGRASCRRGR